MHKKFRIQLPKLGLFAGICSILFFLMFPVVSFADYPAQPSSDITPEQVETAGESGVLGADDAVPQNDDEQTPSAIQPEGTAHEADLAESGAAEENQVLDGDQSSSEAGNPAMVNAANQPNGSVIEASDAQTNSMSTAPTQGVKNGWVSERGKTYYYENGKRVTGEKRLPDPDTGVLHWYYFWPVDGGAMDVGWALLPPTNGLPQRWVYYDNKGHMVYGEQYIDGHWYSFNPYNGAVIYGFCFQPAGNKWVYYHPGSGQMLYGEQYIDGGWYYLQPYTGAVTYEWTYLPEANKWVYYDKYSGIMAHGTVDIDGETYTFNEYTGEADESQRLRWMLSFLNPNPGINLFNGATCSDETYQALVQAADTYFSRGYNLGFIMMDLQTGEGVSCNAEFPIYGASSVKAPYIASLFKYAFGDSVGAAQPYWGSLYNTCVFSSNEDYAYLHRRFGAIPKLQFMNEAGMKGPWGYNMYTTLSAHDLGRLWVTMYSYFNHGNAGGACRDLLSHAYVSGIRDELAYQYPIASKAGWIASNLRSTVDAGIVYADTGPYLLVIESSAPDQFNIMKPLIRALENVHWESTR